MFKLILVLLIMAGLLLTGTAQSLAAQSGTSQTPSETEVRILQSGESISEVRQTGYAFRSTDIIGSDVQNPKGEKLATINNLIIDVQTGQIAFAVLSCGDFLGFGGNLFAIPWEEFTPKPTSGIFMFDVTKEELEKAPVFTPDEWPDLQNRQWADEIYGYYNSTPGLYGYRYGYGYDGSVATRGWELGMPYGSVFDPNTVETFEAEVTRVDRFVPMAGMTEGIELLVESDGKPINVHLGPSWYLNYQDFNLNKGDQIEVTGSRVETGGMPVVIATQIKTDQWTLNLRTETGYPVWSAVTSPPAR